MSTFASVFPRQFPSSLIFSSINREADLFMNSSNFRTYLSIYLRDCHVARTLSQTLSPPCRHSCRHLGVGRNKRPEESGRGTHECALHILQATFSRCSYYRL